MNRKELEKAAKELGIEVTTGMKNEELAAKIAEAKAKKEELEKAAKAAGNIEKTDFICPRCKAEVKYFVGKKIACSKCNVVMTDKKAFEAAEKKPIKEGQVVTK